MQTLVHIKQTTDLQLTDDDNDKLEIGIAKVRKNMKPHPLSDFDALLLKKRMLIESGIKEIKTQTQLQHTWHRSFINFQVNMVAALIAYTYLEKKPSLNLPECKRVPTATLSLEP